MSFKLRDCFDIAQGQGAWSRFMNSAPNDDPKPTINPSLREALNELKDLLRRSMRDIKTVGINARDEWAVQKGYKLAVKGGHRRTYYDIPWVKHYIA